METISVSLRKDVFEKLKALAEPLVDDATSVIERLIKHWESSRPTSAARTTAAVSQEQKFWRSARGEKLPVGAKLRAKYLRKLFEAKVTASGIEFDGNVYDNPSSAGIAAKHAVGTRGKAANTNGWAFWEMLDPESKQWVSIDALRTKNAA